MMQISESTLRYGVAQLGNGTSPAEARRTALFIAGDLATTAEALRKAVRPRPGARRAMARRLAAQGMPRRQVAEIVGVSEKTLYRYLRPRSPAPGAGA